MDHLPAESRSKNFEVLGLILRIGSASPSWGVAEAGGGWIAGVSPISGRKSNQTVPQEIASS